MLCIKTFLSISSVSGLGLFADEFIEEGRLIWKYVPQIDITYSKAEWEKLKVELSTECFSMIERYTYKENGEYILCMDNAQFMNHSEHDWNIVNSDDLKSMRATRPIEKGEELLCDYFEYSDSDDHHRQFLTGLKSQQSEPLNCC